MIDKANMNEILISVYVKVPTNTTAQKLYDNMVLAVIIDRRTGIIKDLSITFATDIAKKYIYDILVGTNLNENMETVIDYVEHTYFGHLKKLLIDALRMLHREYKMIIQGGNKQQIQS